jgi:hypothetical protein
MIIFRRRQPQFTERVVACADAYRPADIVNGDRGEIAREVEISDSNHIENLDHPGVKYC